MRGIREQFLTEGVKILLLHDMTVGKNKWKYLLECGDCHGTVVFVAHIGKENRFGKEKLQIISRVQADRFEDPMLGGGEDCCMNASDDKSDFFILKRIRIVSGDSVFDRSLKTSIYRLLNRISHKF